MELFKDAGGAFKKNNNKAFTRNIFIKQNEINDIIKRFNYTDVYTTPYYYKNRIRSNSLLYACSSKSFCSLMYSKYFLLASGII